MIMTTDEKFISRIAVQSKKPKYDTRNLYLTWMQLDENNEGKWKRGKGKQQKIKSK